MPTEDDRPGDVRLPAQLAAGTTSFTLTAIGVVLSSNVRGGETPKNPAKARETGQHAILQLAEPYRLGLVGLADYSHVIVLGWFDAARRDLIQITRPSSPSPKGVFALRAPVRPNPIALSIARIVSVDVAKGQIEIDAIDFLDGTAILDIKPYRPGIDAIPDAVVP